MPNCDYYATLEDHRIILDFIFSQGSADIYESYSKYEEPLKQFKAPDEVFHEFENTYKTGKKWNTVYLKIHIKESNVIFNQKYIKLDPKSCDGNKFRYSAEGFGLIQLHLSIPSDNELVVSHTNHFTQKGSEKWVGISTTREKIEEINFKAINAFSSRLNREIRKLGVAKIGSKILTKSALDLWNKGFMLTPFTKEHNSLVMIEK